MLKKATCGSSFFSMYSYKNDKVENEAFNREASVSWNMKTGIRDTKEGNPVSKGWESMTMKLRFWSKGFSGQGVRRDKRSDRQMTADSRGSTCHEV